MVAILPCPEFQFVDADGKPYAGGTLSTFVPGTTTGKVTWSEPSGTVINSNPITLDAAGRAIVYGDGDYRLILNDAAGNLIFDQPSSTIVSAAMEPVVAAPDLATARHLLGVDDAIASEAAARAAADSTITNNLNSEIARATAAEATLTTDLNNEIARAEAAENALQTTLNSFLGARGGSGMTSSSGTLSVTFSPAFTTACYAMVGCTAGVGWYNQVSCSISGTTGGTVTVWADTPGGAPVNGAEVYWIAVGV